MVLHLAKNYKDEEAGGADKTEFFQRKSKKYWIFYNTIFYFAICLFFCTLWINRVTIFSWGNIASRDIATTFGYSLYHSKSGSPKHVTRVGMYSRARNISGDNPYFYKTLSSVLPALKSNINTSTYTGYNSSDPISLHVFVDNANRFYLDFLMFNRNIKILELEEVEKSLMKYKSLEQRASYNNYRMLKYFINLAEGELSKAKTTITSSPKSYGFLTFFEDDLIITHDAPERLDAAVANVEEVLGVTADFILSPYRWELNKISTFEDRVFSHYVYDHYTDWPGSLALYIPLRTAKKLADWFGYYQREEKPFIPDKHQITLFSLTYGIPILAMKYSFVRHIGKVSTESRQLVHEGIVLAPTYNNAFQSF